MRRAVLMCLAILSGSLLVACSGDRTPDRSGEREGAEESSNSTTTVSDDEFEAQAERIEEETNAADGDFCQLMISAGSAFAVQPANAAQAEVAVGAIAQLLRDLAQADGVDAGDAAELTSTAQLLTESAEASDFDPRRLAEGEFAEILQEPAFTSSMQALAARAATDCSSSEPPPASVPD